MIASDSSSIELVRNVSVSRETMDRLRRYQELLARWNSKINLVSRKTVPDTWTRHIVDSAQLWGQCTEFAEWIDIGSGAGFPGMVLAIIASEKRPGARFHLVESDVRKCAFLRNIARETNTTVRIHAKRAEELSEIAADVVSARALASLDRLLILAKPLLIPGGHCLFLKGQNCDTELSEARKSWKFDLKMTPSVTEQQSSILRIGELERV